MENNGTVETNGATVDYKTEYEKMVAERDNYKAEAEKQKRMKDQYATENADYKKQEADRKKKELESMPELERLQQELEAERNATKLANDKIAEMEHKQSGIENGFTVDEVSKLIGSNVDFKVLKEIVSARVDEAVKSAKAEMTKGSTSKDLLGKGSTEKTNEKSDFQKYQESKSKQNKIVKLN